VLEDKELVDLPEMPLHQLFVTGWDPVTAIGPEAIPLPEDRAGVGPLVAEDVGAEEVEYVEEEELEEEEGEEEGTEEEEGEDEEEEEVEGGEEEERGEESRVGGGMVEVESEEDDVVEVTRRQESAQVTDPEEQLLDYGPTPDNTPLKLR